MLKREELGKRKGTPGGAMHDPQFAKKYPVLFDYLSQVRWEDGTKREQSALHVYPEGGVVRVLLQDRAMGVCCWVACGTLSEVFDVLEAALTDPGHEWRVDRKWEGQAAKRVKPGKPLDNGQS